ncbi:MAG: GNAT family N-acetyltransferase, partial [Actinomycetota bacterium]|nr:GNAT family N-acetyltransferase [Actinomycetota bacterium]
MADLGEVEIDWWPAAKIGELQAFIDAEWKRGHVLATDEDLLRWQHPRDDDCLSVVAATADGEIVGILGVIPADLCVRGARASGGWLTTWAVVPAFRKHRVGLA